MQLLTRQRTYNLSLSPGIAGDCHMAVKMAASSPWALPGREKVIDEGHGLFRSALASLCRRLGGQSWRRRWSENKVIGPHRLKSACALQQVSEGRHSRRMAGRCESSEGSSHFLSWNLLDEIIL